MHDHRTYLARVQAPLVIGVTGHRDLREQDVPHLERKIRGVFVDLRREYSHTPFILLSSLAEGADRLVARVSLLEEIGAHLIVPLPMRRDLYEEDFETLESIGEFQELLDQAQYWFELPICTSVEAVRRDGPERDRQYAELGKYVARQSQILIALWDGVDTKLAGGTAEVIQFQTKGLPESSTRSIQPPELFPAYQIVTPRIRNPHPNVKPFTVTHIYPDGFGGEEKAAEYYAKIFRYLDDFNADVARGGEAFLAATAQSKKYLADGLDEVDLHEAQALTLNRYAAADTLAIHFQKKMIQTHQALHWIVFAAFVTFVLFAHLPGNPWPCLLAALVLATAAWIIHEWARRNRFDSKHQDYRAVAEGLRVKFFWGIAGVHDSVADNYLGRQRTELDWIRNGLRGWGIGRGEEGHLPAHLKSKSGNIEPLNFVRKHWVNDQHRYFVKATKSNLEQLERYEKWVHGSLWAVGIAAVAVFVARLFNLNEHWLDAGVILIDVLLACGALMHNYIGRMAYTEHSKQYRRMAAIFERAREVLAQMHLPEEFEYGKNCLRALGKEALEENGDWVLLHRERPLEVPHP